MGLMEGARCPPNELTRTRDAFVIVEGPFNNVRLLDFRVLMERQRRTRLPTQQTGHLASLFIFVENLNLNPLELAWLPIEILGLNINRTTNSRFDLGLPFGGHLLLPYTHKGNNNL